MIIFLVSVLISFASWGETTSAGSVTMGGTTVRWSRATFPLRGGCQGVRSDSRGLGYYGAPRRHGTHAGVDWYAPLGEPIVSPWPGTVTTATTSAGAYGGYVVVLHDNGLETRYGHLQQVAVTANTRVVQGTVLGTVGKTGNASHRHTHPHLHFEVRLSGSRLNPADPGLFGCDCYSPQSDANRRRSNVGVCR